MADDVLDNFPSEEDKHHEFKQSASGLHETMSAFANTDGGKILVGVKDDGSKMQGLEARSLSDEKSNVNDERADCMPTVDVEMRVEDDILVIEVPRGSSPPYKAPDGIYVREDGNNRKLNRKEEVKFYQETGEIRFEDRLRPEFELDKDIDRVAFQQFLSEADITDNQSIEDHLLELGLGSRKEDGFVINNAGLLMFAENPKRFVTQSEIICGAKQSMDTATLEDREIIDGPLIQMIESAEEFIKRNTA